MAKKRKTGPAASGKAAKAKPAASSTSAKPKKSSQRKGSAASKPAPKPAAPVAFEPTDEQIQMRAYFISERRRRFDLPGDANSDWLEAKRQLLSEIRAVK